MDVIYHFGHYGKYVDGYQLGTFLYSTASRQIDDLSLNYPMAHPFLYKVAH